MSLPEPLQESKDYLIEKIRSLDSPDADMTEVMKLVNYLNAINQLVQY